MFRPQFRNRRGSFPVGTLLMKVLSSGSTPGAPVGRGAGSDRSCTRAKFSAFFPVPDDDPASAVEPRHRPLRHPIVGPSSSRDPPLPFFSSPCGGRAVHSVDHAVQRLALVGAIGAEAGQVRLPQQRSQLSCHGVAFHQPLSERTNSPRPGGRHPCQERLGRSRRQRRRRLRLLLPTLSRNSAGYRVGGRRTKVACRNKLIASSAEHFASAFGSKSTKVSGMACGNDGPRHRPDEQRASKTT